GAIPPDLGKLSALLSLDLSRNQLNGLGYASRPISRETIAELFRQTFVN
ncbi:unnamed protein product, partial [Ascophyllum nodosum]